MKIFIKNLTCKAILGILESERTQAQNIIIDAKIKYDFDTKHFIDYAQVAKSMQDLMQKEKFLLIEDALENIVATLKQKFPTIKQITLKISKPDILDNCVVGAKIKKNFINF